MSTRTCGACGGPLRTRDREHHGTVVVCEYCGVETSLASPGAEAAAVALEKVGLRLPERPMTSDELDEEVAQRAAHERERLRSMRLLAVGIFVAVSLLVGLLVGMSG